MGPRRRQAQPSTTRSQRNTRSTVKRKGKLKKEDVQLHKLSTQALLSQLPTLSVRLSPLNVNDTEHRGSYENTSSKKNRMLPNLSTQDLVSQLPTLSVRLSPLNIKSEPGLADPCPPVRESAPLFSCMFCEYVNADRAILSLHMTEVHKCRPIFSCTDCDYKTDVKEHFADHLASHAAVFDQAHEEEEISDFEKDEVEPEIYNDKDESFGYTDVNERLSEENFPESAPALVNGSEEPDTSKTAGTESTSNAEIALENLLEMKRDFETFASFKEALKETPKLIQYMPRSAFSNETEFSCFKCNYTSRTFKTFREHFHEHAGVTPYSCKHCGDQFFSDSARNTHIQDTHLDGNFACDQCSYSTKKEVYLKMHKLGKHATEEDYTFVCPHCPRKFAMKKRLTAHIRVKHIDENKYECDQCDFSTNYRDTFTRHVNKHTDYVYVCPACKKSYHCSGELRRHQRRHKEKFCDRCSYFTSCNENFLKHKDTHSKEPPLQCPQCNFRTTKQYVLVDHKRRHVYNKVSSTTRTDQVNGHTTTEEPAPAKNFKDKQEKVEVCENEIKPDVAESKDQEAEASSETGEATESCDGVRIAGVDLPSEYIEDGSRSSLDNERDENLEEGCDESASGRSSKNETLLRPLKAETDENKNSKATGETNINQRSKTTTAASTTSKNSLIIRAKYESFLSFVEALRKTPDLIKVIPETAFPNEKEFTCFQCGHCVYTMAAFKSHFYEHIGYAPLSCKHCEAKFTRYTLLLAHNRSKHQTKMFNCPLCTFSTKRMIQLNYHMLSRHPSEEDFKFQCPVCPQKFALKRNLKSHLQSKHTHEKKYMCDRCSFTTNYLESFRTHMNRHKGIVFLCAVCGNSYPSERLLKNHMKSHMNTHEIFYCERCPFSTHTRSILNSHRLVHSVETPYKCPYCNSRFKSTMLLQQHKKRHRDSKGNFRRINAQRRRQKPNRSPVPDTPNTQSHELSSMEGKVEDQPEVFSEETIRGVKSKCTTFSEFREILRQNPKMIQIFPKTAFHKENEFECFKCDYVSRTFKYFREHFFEHAGLTPYTCKYCSAKFSSFYNMFRHIYTTHETQVFKCNICSFSTTRLLLLQRHTQIKHGREEDLFQCPHCPRKFLTQAKMKQHASSFHNELKQYHCDLCPFATDKPDHIKTHLQKHSTEEELKKYPTFEAFKAVLVESPELILSIPRTAFRSENHFACFKCDYVSKSFKYFREHFNQHAGLTPYECKQCGAKFSSAIQMYKHVDTSHGEPMHYCSHCPYSTKSQVSIKKHLLSQHPSPEDFKYLCPQCPEKFSLGRNLKWHILRKHSTEKKFKCDVCDYASNSRDSWVAHKNKHKGMTFPCSTCGKSFSSETAMKNHHKRVHSGLYYSCPQCPHTCRSQTALKDHMASHSDERPYQCPHCPFRAKTPSVLHLHKRQHDPAELKYPCSVCGRKFITKAAVRGHAESHISQVFECTICDYTCRSRGNYRVHLRKHNPATDIKCSMCSKTFIQPKNLTKHLKKAHAGAANIEVTVVPKDEFDAMVAT